MDFRLTKEQRDIVKAAKQFARGEFPDVALELDRQESFPYDLWKKALDLGFVGIFIDEEYGGAGLGFFEYCLVNEEFWAVDPGIAHALMATTFGCELILLKGNAEQKEAVLPRLTSGEAIIGMAITEPDAGCDVTRAATTATREGDEWVISGSKMFTTNGTVANDLVVFCLTDPDNPNRHARHSFILVPTDSPGYSASKIKGKLGIRASDTAEISFSNVRVPVSNTIGKEGEGFRDLMAFFNHTRLHISAEAVGLARGCLEESIRHTRERQQFGAPLASFQVTQFKLAEMATRIRAARNLYYEAAWAVDNGIIDHALIAMAKWYAAETAVACADEALQMHGGYGYIDEYPVNRLYRAAKVLEIYEGTKEMEKTIIGRSLV